MSRRVFAALAFLSLVGARTLYGQDDVVRRIAAASTIALNEYAIGVSNGQVVQEAELEEARLFISQSIDAAAGLQGPEVRLVAEAYLDSLASGLDALADHETLEGLLKRFRSVLEDRSGVALDEFPSGPPSLDSGARLYAASCSQCHGASGLGDGPAGVALDPPPANLADGAALADVTPLDFFRVLSTGVAGTAMRSYSSEFDVEQRWALVLYASGLRHASASADRGAELLAGCEDCLLPASGVETAASISDDSLSRLYGAALGISGDDLADAVAFGREAAALERLGADRVYAFKRVTDRTVTLLEEAADRAMASDAEGAGQLAVDAYLVFERVEPAIRVTAPATALDIERAFADFRNDLSSNNATAIEAGLVDLRGLLARSETVVTDVAEPGVLLGKSVLIILREGLEAILIIGALVAFLAKAGAPERKRDIGLGVGLAVAASLGTAALFATVLDMTVQSQEFVEGLTMLIAASVLFWVSYWLVSKVEMRRWQAFVRQSMGRALGSKSRFALAAVAFLAVYREGFETVLFYAALYASAEGAAPGIAAITTGILVGFAALVALYIAIQRYGVRIPLKPFFAGTSALLYLMAFSFVGQGIAELQASGNVAITPLSWIPTIPALGIFPTMQTVTLQSAMALAVLLALAWVFWFSPRYSEARVNS